MDRHDEQFENFLQEFAPRRPRPLPDALAAASSTFATSICRLAAAAVIAVAAGTSLCFLGRNPSRDQAGVIAKKQLNGPIAPAARQDPFAWTLTRQALEDPARLDAVLAASRGGHLPRFDRENSTLKVLAKE